MGKVSATVTTTQEVSIAPRVQRQLLTEMHAYATHHREVKRLESEKKGHSKNVLDLSLANVDGDNFELEGFKVAVIKDAKTRKLDATKLIKRLVKDNKYSMKAAQALIEDCTTDTPKKPHVRITCPGDDDE